MKRINKKRLKSLYHRRYALLAACILPFILAGCLNVNKYIDSKESIKQELAAPLDIVKLPILVKPAIDKKSINHVVSNSQYYNVSLKGYALILLTAQELSRGVNKAAKLVFKDVCRYEAELCQADLKIRLVEPFIFQYSNINPLYTIVSPSMSVFLTNIKYHTKISIESELVGRDGTTVYKKTLTAESKGWGPSRDNVSTRFGETGAEAFAMLVGLWARKFAKDITTDENVLRYVK